MKLVGLPQSLVSEVRSLSQSIAPTVQKILGLEKLPSIYDARVATSRAFLGWKNHAGSDFRSRVAEFYATNETYPIELAIYAGNPGRIQSVLKRIRVYKTLRITHVADFGAGLGIDGLCYSLAGLKTLNIEYSTNLCSRVSADVYARLNVNRVSLDAAAVTQRIVSGTPLVKNPPWNVIQVIEVVAPLDNAELTFRRLMESCETLVWTNDIGCKNAENDPQHLSHSLSRVLKAIESAGGRKQTLEGIAIPPRVYIRQSA